MERAAEVQHLAKALDRLGGNATGTGAGTTLGAREAFAFLGFGAGFGGSSTTTFFGFGFCALAGFDFGVGAGVGAGAGFFGAGEGLLFLTAFAAGTAPSSELRTLFSRSDKSIDIAPRREGVLTTGTSLD